jgi:hypothetical protein
VPMRHSDIVPENDRRGEPPPADGPEPDRSLMCAPGGVPSVRCTAIEPAWPTSGASACPPLPPPPRSSHSPLAPVHRPIGPCSPGLLFIALSAVSLITDPAPVLDLVFAAAWLSAVLPVVRLHALHQGRDGMWGTVGAWALIAGAVAHVPGLVVQFAGSDKLSWLVLPVGVLLLFVGLVALGVGTWRAGVLPRWFSIGMAAALPLTFLTSIWFPVHGDGSGDYPGVFVMGSFWLSLAIATHRQVNRVQA